MGVGAAVAGSREAGDGITCPAGWGLQQEDPLQPRQPGVPSKRKALTAFLVFLDTDVVTKTSSPEYRAWHTASTQKMSE